MHLKLYEDIDGHKRFITNVKFVLHRAIRFRSNSQLLGDICVTISFFEDDHDNSYQEIYFLFKSAVRFLGKTDKFIGYTITPPKDLSLKVELQQTKWTFWRRWFERYFLQYHIKDDALSRAQLIVERGLFNIETNTEELLYFTDVQYHKSLKERVLGYGDITLFGNETTTKKLTLHNVCKTDAIAMQLNNLIQSLKSKIQRIEYIHQGEPL